MPPWLPLTGSAYLAALLALDHFATYPGQLALGVLTWLALVGACALAAAGVRYTARSAWSAGPAQPLP